MPRINFEQLFTNCRRNQDDKSVERIRRLLANELSYLNEFQVWVGKDPLLEIINESESIGRGAFGQVFKVSDKLGNKYALKRIHLDGTEEKDAKTLREVIACKQLNNPNVVNLYDYWIGIEVGPSIYLFMELCKQNLSDWFEKEPFHGYAGNKEMILQICEGVRYIHSKNMIHRDLKPENILINFQGICKISDFGLSTFHDMLEESSISRSEQTHTYGIGTRLYAAPEQWSGNHDLYHPQIIKRYGYKVDIYSLGCIMLQFCVLFDKFQLDVALSLLKEGKKILKLGQKFENSLIQVMTQKDFSQRPNIEDVIDWIKNDENTIIVSPQDYEIRLTPEGQIYFYNVVNGNSTWNDPMFPEELIQGLNLDQLVGPLLRGYEKKTWLDGRIYYVNHNDRTTQSFDPRLYLVNWNQQEIFQSKNMLE